jgi:DNA-binding NarL/FixJ family response regulator
VLRLLLADDHGVLRAGLRALFDSQRDFEVVAEAETADETISLNLSLQPDLAIVDVHMPGGGLSAVARLKQDRPALRVLVLSQYDDPAYLHEALSAGASGYALKRSSGRELIEAVRSVARGDVYLHPALTRVLVEQSLRPSHSEAPSALEPLSERETQVLRLVALGHTTQQIADQLFLSARTVETYKTRVTDKLGLTGRTALVRFALDHGLLDSVAEA